VALTIPLAINLGARARSEVESQALLAAQTIAAGIGKEGLKAGPALSRQVSIYAQEVPGRVLVMDKDGLVLADSDREAVGDNYATCLRPEILAALGLACASDGTFTEVPAVANVIIRFSNVENADLLLAAAPVLDEGNVAGAVRVTRNIDAVNDEVRTVRIGIVLIGLLGLVAGMAIAFALANSLARPLIQLSDAARKLGDGDLTTRVGDVGGAREVKDLGESFDEMANRFERNVHAQREFVANASHQLRTPLTAMKLRLETAEGDAKDPELRRQLHAADLEVDRLADTVDRMLAMANSIEQGSAALVDLREVALRAATRWGERAEQLGTRVTTGGPSATALTNAVDLDQIVDNLIDNGLAYGVGPIEIETGRLGNRVFLAVRDHGEGIPAAEQTHVTERFYRGRGAPTGGSGLGLAIARDLTEKWGGDLSITEGAGGGARIEVWLRVADPDERSSEQEPEGAQPNRPA